MSDFVTQSGSSTSAVARLRQALSRFLASVDEQKRDTLLLFVVRGGGAACAFLTQIAIARWAGAGIFGIYAVAWTWIMILGTLSQAGFGVAMTRFVARYMERDRHARAWAAIVFSVQFVARLGIATSLVAAAVIYFSTQPGLGGITTSVMYFAMAIVPLYALSELGQGVLRGMGENMRAYVPGFLLRPALLLGFIGLLFVVDIGINEWWLVASTGLSLLVVVLLQWNWIREHGKELSGRGNRRRHAVHWIVVAVPMMMTDAYLLLVSYMDLIVLDLFVSAEMVAVYFAAVKIIALVWFLPFAVSGVSARVLAQDFERDDRVAIKSSVRRFVTWSFLPTCSMSLVIFVFGGYILSYFGPEFESGVTVLRILSVGLVFQAAAGPIRYLMTMTNEQNSSAIILIVSACANIALNFALIPVWGLEGAASATVATQIFATSLMVLQTWRKLHIWSFVSFPRSVRTNLGVADLVKSDAPRISD